MMQYTVHVLFTIDSAYIMYMLWIGSTGAFLLSALLKNHLHTCLLGPVVPPCLASLSIPEKTHTKTHTVCTRHKMTKHSTYLCMLMQWRAWQLCACGLTLSPGGPGGPEGPGFPSGPCQIKNTLSLKLQSTQQNHSFICSANQICRTAYSLHQLKHHKPYGETVKTRILLIKCTFKKISDSFWSFAVWQEVTLISMF